MALRKTTHNLHPVRLMVEAGDVRAVWPADSFGRPGTARVAYAAFLAWQFGLPITAFACGHSVNSSTGSISAVQANVWVSGGGADNGGGSGVGVVINGAQD